MEKPAMDERPDTEAHLGQIVDYLYIPPHGDAPEEAVASVLDLDEDRVRVGPDASEAILALAREGHDMQGRFVTFVPAEDPKQIGELAPLELERLHEADLRRLQVHVQAGHCVPPPSEDREALEPAFALPNAM